MKLTRTSLGNPVAVVVAVIMVALFGFISLVRLPVQLTPQVDQPFISINTFWRAAAPQEVESEIIEPQEDVLRGLPGVTRIASSASQGNGSIRVEFDLAVDINRSLIEVMNRLNQVPRYPPDANEPVIRVSGDAFSGVVAWFAIRPLPDNDRDIATYQDFVREVVQDRIERVPGVASTNAFGGRPYEVRVTFDPYKAASLGIDLSAIAGRLNNNVDVSGGFNEVGRRQYTIRYAGQFEVAELGDLVLDWRDGRPIHLKDIATVERTMQDRSGILAQNGSRSIAMNAIPETGVNVLQVMNGIREAVEELRQDVLPRAGLQMTLVYDVTTYIDAAIRMVRNNLILGMLLAIGVLWWFLRKMRATLIVALTIPICLLVAFTFLDAAGRTLNVISLAGLAFATGMVLDAAIVVLENIVRLRERGSDSDEAANRGATQVWGALLASTATTVAIFLPVVFLKDVAGQLFADLALTISITVVASLLVAVTVLPTAAAKLLRSAELKDRHASWWNAISDKVMELTDSPQRRIGWIAGLLIIPMLLVVLLKPDTDYLPEGKMNFIFAFMLLPPGLGMDTGEEELVQPIMDRMQPFLDGEAEPHVDNYFVGVFRGFGGFLGARAVNRGDVDALLMAFNTQILQGFPDTMAFAQRANIFRSFSGGRSIDLDLQARDFDSLLDAGRAGYGAIMGALPGAQIRPQPGLDLAEPELRLIPDDHRIAESGWDRQRLATVVRAMGDGAFVGEYFDGDRRLDIILRSEEWYTPEELMALPVATPNGAVQPLGAMVQLSRTAGPDQIRRIDRRRTLTLTVVPPPGVSLEEAIEILRTEVAPVIQPLLPEDGTIAYRGTAEDMDIALKNMSGSFLLAIAILYLLMSALFKSFKDSLMVILTIPMATVGGVLALRLLNLFTFQPMDLLTMIGFIIVLGLIVNNAILLVHQSRAAEREGMSRRDAVNTAVHLRLRPILMSTLTSIFGMLPLLLMPGAGTELYRGLASVIVGGMLVSTAFTLILLPSLLRIGEEKSVTAPAGKGAPGPAYAQRHE